MIYIEMCPFYTRFTCFYLMSRSGVPQRGEIANSLTSPTLPPIPTPTSLNSVWNGEGRAQCFPDQTYDSIPAARQW